MPCLQLELYIESSNHDHYFARIPWATYHRRLQGDNNFQSCAIRNEDVRIYVLDTRTVVVILLIWPSNDTLSNPALCSFFCAQVAMQTPWTFVIVGTRCAPTYKCQECNQEFWGGQSHFNATWSVLHKTSSRLCLFYSASQLMFILGPSATTRFPEQQSFMFQ